MARFGKSIKYSGPSLNKIIKKLEKNNINMVKESIRESVKVVRKEAREIAPVVSGKYRKAIRLSVRSNVRRGEVTGRVGIRRGDPVMKYAKLVERKHNIYTRLEKTQATPVRKTFEIGIRKYFNKLKIN